LLLKPRDADDVTRGDLAVGILNDLRRGLARPPEQLPGEGAGGGEERLAADDQGTGEILEAVLDPRVGVLGANTDRLDERLGPGGEHAGGEGLRIDTGGLGDLLGRGLEVILTDLRLIQPVAANGALGDDRGVIPREDL